MTEEEKLIEKGVYKHTDKHGINRYQIEKPCGALGVFWNLSLYMSEDQWKHIENNEIALKLIHDSMQLTVTILEQAGYQIEDESDTAGPRT